MFAIFAFAAAARLLGPAFTPIVAAAAIGPMAVPRTRSEEIEPWDS